MATRYTVYYSRVLALAFSTPVDVDHRDFDLVTTIEADDLEDLFRKMNVVDGTEAPIRLRVRSMCSGDVAVDADGKVWFCASCGWEETHWRWGRTPETKVPSAEW